MKRKVLFLRVWLALWLGVLSQSGFAQPSELCRSIADAAVASTTDGQGFEGSIGKRMAQGGFEFTRKVPGLGTCRIFPDGPGKRNALRCEIHVTHIRSLANEVSACYRLPPAVDDRQRYRWSGMVGEAIAPHAAKVLIELSMAAPQTAGTVDRGSPHNVELLIVQDPNPAPRRPIDEGAVKAAEAWHQSVIALQPGGAEKAALVGGLGMLKDMYSARSMAAAMLAPHWLSMSSTQKAEFSELVARMFASYMAGFMDGMRPEAASLTTADFVDFSTIGITSARATLIQASCQELPANPCVGYWTLSRWSRPNNTAYLRVFWTQSADDRRWYIFDASLYGMSFVEAYRASFASHIRQKGIDDLQRFVETRFPSDTATTRLDSASSGPRCAPPFYITVPSGTSLFDIAKQAGQNWRDVARWNALEPNAIRVGQVLRVRPPECGPG